LLPLIVIAVLFLAVIGAIYCRYWCYLLPLIVIAVLFLAVIGAIYCR